MTKILLFLVLIFTFVPIRAQWFDNAGKNKGIEVWYSFNEQNSEVKLNKMDDVNPEELQLFGSFSYIILETKTKSKRSRSYSYNIYYIIRHKFELEKNKKIVEYVIKLWEQIGFKDVTLTRETFKTTLEVIPFSLISKEAKTTQVKLKDFENCRQIRLYKLTRSDETSGCINMWQVPVKKDQLTGINDFIFECDSKALVFNLSEKEPEYLSIKLAMLITNNELKIFVRTWSLKKLPPEWILIHFNYTSDIQTFMVTSQQNSTATFTIDVELSDSMSIMDYSLTLMKESYVNNPINVKSCYILRNKIVMEAVVFIGNVTNFKQIETCLKIGEELDIVKRRGVSFQLISVTQKKTLSAPFVLPFYEFQTHFHELSDVNPNKILLLLQK